MLTVISPAHFVDCPGDCPGHDQGVMVGFESHFQSIPEYPMHELASSFPKMTEPEAFGLALDIKMNGLKEPITIWRGMIIDGRHRYEACKSLVRTGEMNGANVRFDHLPDEVNEESARAFVKSKNIGRRHLSQGQKAIIAAGWDRRTWGVHGKSSENQNSLKTLSDSWGVSKPTLSSAISVFDYCAGVRKDKVLVKSGREYPANWELYNAVFEGVQSVDDADATVSGLIKKEIAEVEREQERRMAEIRRREAEEKAAAEAAERERLEAERQAAAEVAEQERLEAEQAAAERRAKEAEAKRLLAEKEAEAKQEAAEVAKQQSQKAQVAVSNAVAAGLESKAKGEKKGKVKTKDIVAESENRFISNKTGDEEWYTPAPYLEAARAALGGHIGLDPASHPLAQEVVQAEVYFTKQDNGLAQDWRAETLFINPPYTAALQGEFAYKLVCELDAGDVKEAVWLGNSHTDTAWYQRLARRCDAMFFPASRQKFWQPKLNADGDIVKETQSNHIASTLFYFGSEIERFKESFRPLGGMFSGPMED